MTAEQVQSPAVLRKSSRADVVLDGVFAGMIGALVVAAWFLILDLAHGRPLFTPALLGSVLLHGTAAAQSVSIQPLEVAAYTAFHFLVFLGVGIGLSYLMTLFERFPIMFFVLLVLFLCLQLGFFVLDLALGAALMGTLKPWTVIVGNLLAAAGMAFYLMKRHPSVLEGVEHLWDHEQ